jgi:hypothetical protein
LKGRSVRFGFCAAVAVIAAAIADPIVEFASNTGWFGRGSFTDHGNLDVAPALLAGLALLAFYLVRKARALLSGEAFPRGVAPLLPTIFVLQIFTLYVMESAEQLIAWGHILGPAVWLGAPSAISLAFHATVCLAVTLWIGRSVGTLAATTLRVIRLIRALATLAVNATEVISRGFVDEICFKQPAPVPCRIGERAPPVAGI